MVMSEPVLAVVVLAVSGVMTSVAGIITMVVKAKLDRNEKVWQLTNQYVLEAKTAIEEQRANIDKIEKQGNSIQTEMVRLTDEAAQARGEKKGREDEKAEVAAKALVIKDLEGAVLTAQQMEAVEAAKELLRKAAVVADVVLQDAAKKAQEKTLQG